MYIHTRADQHRPILNPTSSFLVRQHRPIPSIDIKDKLDQNVDCSFKRDTEPISAPGIAIVIPPSLPAPTCTPDCVPPLLYGVI